MTTSHSPRSALKVQADKIAATLKAAERGDKIDVQFAEKISAVRPKDRLKIAIAMDDKIITIEMAWVMIRDTNEASLAEYILKQMQNDGAAVN